MKSSSNVYISDDTRIEAKIFLHDAISRFPITYHNFHILQCTDMGTTAKRFAYSWGSNTCKFLYSTSDGLLDRSDQLQAVILQFSTVRI